MAVTDAPGSQAAFDPSPAGGAGGEPPFATSPASVSHEDGIWLVGGDLPPAWRLAAWQGDGAALWWDAAEPRENRGVVVTDADRALPWIGDVCGDDLERLIASGRTAGAVGAGASRGPDGEQEHQDVAGAEGEPAAVAIGLARTPLAQAAEAVAFARWRQAWWPASRLRLVPPLDPRLVAAEQVLALDDLAMLSTRPRVVFRGEGFAAVTGGTRPEGLAPEALTSRAVAARLVDDAALDAALRELAAAERRHGELPEPADPDDPHHIAGAAHALADRRGIRAPVSPQARDEPADHALHRAPEPTRAALSGAVAVDASCIRNGVVDAADEARWHVVFRGAVPSIVVEVLAAPRFANEPSAEPALHASFAGVSAPLQLSAGVWRAEQPVPLSALAAPPADRAVLLYVPDRDVRRSAADPDELIGIAHRRLIAPVSPSEREAAAREVR